MGLEYNPVASELAPTANWVALAETVALPMVSFGTSSDRIFSPAPKRAYFVTAAKGVPGTTLAPYLSLSYSEFERRFIVPFGVNIGLAREWDLLAMNDGRRTHALLTFKTERMNYTLMAIDLKRPRLGLSIGVGF